MQFPCTSCGACCRQSPPHGLKRSDNGACQYYDESSRLCSIYENRPLVCRVREGYEVFYRPHVEEGRLWMMVADTCKTLDPQTNGHLPAQIAAELHQLGLDSQPSETDRKLYVQIALAAYEVPDNHLPLDQAPVAAARLASARLASE